MTIAYNVNSSSGKKNGNATWNHAAASSDVTGAIVYIVCNNSLRHPDSVLYGGVPMTEIGYSNDNSGEIGSVSAWFLGSSIPQGTQIITVAQVGSVHWVGSCVTVTGDADTSYRIASLGEGNRIPSNLADPSVDVPFGSGYGIGTSAQYSGLSNHTSIYTTPGFTKFGSENFGNTSTCAVFGYRSDPFYAFGTLYDGPIEPIGLGNAFFYTRYWGDNGNPDNFWNGNGGSSGVWFDPSTTPDTSTIIGQGQRIRVTFLDPQGHQAYYDGRVPLHSQVGRFPNLNTYDIEFNVTGEADDADYAFYAAQWNELTYNGGEGSPVTVEAFPRETEFTISNTSVADDVAFLGAIIVENSAGASLELGLSDLWSSGTIYPNAVQAPLNAIGGRPAAEGEADLTGVGTLSVIGENFGRTGEAHLTALWSMGALGDVRITPIANLTASSTTLLVTGATRTGTGQSTVANVDQWHVYAGGSGNTPMVGGILANPGATRVVKTVFNGPLSSVQASENYPVPVPVVNLLGTDNEEFSSVTWGSHVYALTRNGVGGESPVGDHSEIVTTDVNNEAVSVYIPILSGGAASYNIYRSLSGNTDPAGIHEWFQVASNLPADTIYTDKLQDLELGDNPPPMKIEIPSETGNIGIASFTDFIVGGPSGLTDAYIHEIVLADNTLTDAAADRIWQYLSDKYTGSSFQSDAAGSSITTKEMLSFSNLRTIQIATGGSDWESKMTPQQVQLATHDHIEAWGVGVVTPSIKSFDKNGNVFSVTRAMGQSPFDPGGVLPQVFLDGEYGIATKVGAGDLYGDLDNCYPRTSAVVRILFGSAEQISGDATEQVTYAGTYELRLLSNGATVASTPIPVIVGVWQEIEVLYVARPHDHSFQAVVVETSPQISITDTFEIGMLGVFQHPLTWEVSNNGGLDWQIVAQPMSNASGYVGFKYPDNKLKLRVTANRAGAVVTHYVVTPWYVDSPTSSIDPVDTEPRWGQTGEDHIWPNPSFNVWSHFFPINYSTLVNDVLPPPEGGPLTSGGG